MTTQILLVVVILLMPSVRCLTDNVDLKNQRLKDRIVKVTLNVEQSFKGMDKEITYKSKESCQMCAGTGGNKNVCSSCGGRGVHQQKVGTGFFTQIVETQCPTCQGKGQIVIDPCMNCNGVGAIDKFKNIRVTIPKSVDNGDFLRVTGKGDYINGIQGDLLVQINLVKDKYEKVGRDLVYQLMITPVDMITNQTINSLHILMVTYRLTLPKQLSTEKPLRIKSKGFVTGNGIGDFYIKISVINKETNRRR